MLHAEPYPGEGRKLLPIMARLSYPLRTLERIDAWGGTEMDETVSNDGPQCPDCGAPALPVMWGMPAGDPGPGVILGGCIIIDFPPPPHGCRECGWMGDLADGRATQP